MNTYALTNRQKLLNSVFKNQGNISDFHRVNSGVRSEAVSTTLSKLEKDGLIYSSGTPKKWFAKNNIDILPGTARVCDSGYKSPRTSYTNECLKALGVRIYKTSGDLAKSLNLDPHKVGRALSFLDSQGKVQSVMRRHKSSDRLLKHYRLQAPNGYVINEPEDKPGLETDTPSASTDEEITIYVANRRMLLTEARDLYRSLKTIFSGDQK